MFPFYMLVPCSPKKWGAALRTRGVKKKKLKTYLMSEIDQNKIKNNELEHEYQARNQRLHQLCASTH